jgi:CBS domain-containing protein
MRKNNVGSLVVVDEHRRPMGIVTDRDIVLRGVAEGAGPGEAVDVTMTQDLVTAFEHDDIFDVATAMATRACRRIPVLADDGALVGVVALDDLIVLLTNESAKLAHAVSREVAR